MSANGSEQITRSRATGPTTVLPLGTDTAATPLRMRSIRRRVPLPGARAVVGAFLVTAAAVGTYVATTAPPPPAERFLVATRALPAGHVIGPDDVLAVAGDLPAEVVRTLLVDPRAAVGGVLLAPVERGAPLAGATVEPAASPGGASSGPSALRYRELSVSVPVGRAVDARLRPGDRVDVLSSTDEVTTVLVQQAMVLAVDDGSDGGLVDRGEVVVTLALDDPAATLAVAHGAAVGELTLVRSNRATEPLAAAFEPATREPDARSATGRDTGAGR